MEPAAWHVVHLPRYYCQQGKHRVTNTFTLILTLNLTILETDYALLWMTSVEIRAVQVLVQMLHQPQIWNAIFTNPSPKIIMLEPVAEMVSNSASSPR